MINLREIEARLARPPVVHSFSEGELDGLPPLARRYLEAAIAPGTPVAQSTRLRIRGSIKLGSRWLPFRSRELLAPHHGFIWRARVAGGLMAGSDHYADRHGAMAWRLLGLVPVMRAEGPDLSRSAAGRCAGEALWLPTALLPRFGVNWTAADENHLTAQFPLDDTTFELRYQLGDNAHVRSVEFKRWGDPDQSGTWATHPFGLEVSANATFDGLTVPSAGSVGWFHGTDRWPEGEFFRYAITDLRLIT